MRAWTALSTVIAITLAGATLAAHAANPPPRADSAPPMAAFCAGCHAATPGTMMGFLDTVSDKAQALQLDFGTHKAVVSFDRDTVLKNVDSVADLQNYKRKGFLVRFEDKGGRKHATSIVRFDIAETIGEDEKLSKAAFKAALDDPSVTVLDVRPTPMYQAAHVPGATSMPAPAVADYPKRLPEDRSSPVVLYGPGGCLGPTTSLRVKQLGYTNVKIYPLGFADWTKTEPSVTEPQWLRRAIDEDLGVIVLDVRGADAVAAGHIRGAVNIPLSQLPRAGNASRPRPRHQSSSTARAVTPPPGSWWRGATGPSACYRWTTSSGRRPAIRWRRGRRLARSSTSRSQSPVPSRSMSSSNSPSARARMCYWWTSAIRSKWRSRPSTTS
jgi:rhodanese-related sulfurtransferase